ncbi:hypothetical protein FRACA_2310012 [Frankia canadensis]|uniref:Uncharacterized protein n=1 Tax=Frankia canadensis TaxID=1836972 RepID=A0A2I2KRK0_9ACTN|nr:hypothetical protein FRACA_2310012 [Frankia canadensis]SOU55556.1 hypothetical protein FRACA_2310012 [Frankia canadensis]
MGSRLVRRSPTHGTGDQISACDSRELVRSLKSIHKSNDPPADLRHPVIQRQRSPEPRAGHTQSLRSWIDTS